MLEVAIQKRFEGFSLDVAFVTDHSFVILFGPSGSGKSLTLQALAGAIQPDHGRIVIDNSIIYDHAQRILLPPQTRRIGYVPQHYALFPHLTVEKNIAFGLSQMSRSGQKQRVKELLDLFSLQGLAHRRPHELSGGQQQRVALARALAVQPRLLLLDEPFAALDAPLRTSLRQELLQLQERLALKIVLVSHDHADAFALGQQIIVYNNGRVIQQGARDDIFFRPATRRVAELVGTRNILPATVERTEKDLAWVQWQGRRIVTRPTTLTVGAPVFLCIRPTQILVVRADRLEERPRENVLTGKIVDETMLAETYTLHVQLDNGRSEYDLELELPGYVYHRLALARGQRIMIELRREALQVIPKDNEED
jgi:molybdate transport system ATP-binding protein